MPFLTNQQMQEKLKQTSGQPSGQSATTAQQTSPRSITNEQMQQKLKRDPQLPTIGVQDNSQQGWLDSHPWLKKGVEAATGAVDLANKGVETFSNLPGIKQAGQAYGSVIGPAAGVVGGAIAGQLEAGKQVVQVVRGEGFDASKIAETASKEYGKSKEFFGGLAEQAVPAALTGGASKYVQGGLAVAQGIGGAENLKKAIETGDEAAIAEAAANFGVSVLTAKSSYKGFKNGKKGTIFDPDVKAQVKSEVSNLKSRFTGVSPVEAATKKASGAYREVLKPTQAEVKKFEVKQGKELEPLYRQMAEEKLPVGKSVEGKLDTADARAAVSEKMNLKEQQLQSLLEKQPEVSHSLFDLTERASKEIDKLDIPAVDKQAMKANAQKFLEAEIQERFKGQEVPNLNNVEYNQLKRNMYQLGYDMGNPTGKPAARIIGRLIKNDIETRNPDQAIKSTNAELGKYSDISSLLENAHGRVVKGGRMANYISRLGGAIVGATAGGTLSAIPGMGVVGALAGEHVAGKIQERLADPSKITERATRKIDEAKALPPSMFSGDIKKQIRSLVSEELDPNKQQMVEIFEAQPKTIEAGSVKGVDLQGYSHMMDKSGIQHALNEHGKDHMPVTVKDFEKIPEILQNPDNVTMSYKNKRGMETLLYSKRYNGTTYYLEEIRKGKKRLALNTMYKNKTPK